MKIAFIEESLTLSGGMRRVIELSNRLVDMGHEVEILIIHDEEPLTCNWIKVKSKVKSIHDRSEYHIAVMNHAPCWVMMNNIVSRLKVYYWLGFEAAYFVKQQWYDAYQQSYFVIANSNWTADMAQMYYGTKPPVVYGGVDTKQFHPVKVEKKYELLCSCPSNRPEKGLFELQRAASILRMPLVNMADKNLTQDELAKEYSKAKIFIAAPYVEGFYFPGIEAMACGTPVIMADAGGNRDYADNGNNCIMVTRNAGEIAMAIKTLRYNEEWKNKLIANGIKTAKQYSWDKCAVDFCSVVFGEYAKLE